MDAGRVSGRYSIALLNWATEQGCGEAVYKESTIFLTAFESNLRFKELVLSGGLHATKVNSLLIGFSRTFAPTLEPFIRLIINKQRISHLQSILAHFQVKYRKQIGLTQVVVTCAYELGHKGKQEMERFLSGEIEGAHETVFLIRPEIIGGFIANIEGRQLDRSTRSELLQINKGINDIA